MKLGIRNAKIVTRYGLCTNDVVVVDSKIAEVGYNVVKNHTLDLVLDGEGKILGPGFCDTHVHGAVGNDTMDASLEGLFAMAEFFASQGVTSFYATTMSDDPERIIQALLNARDYIASPPYMGARLEGVHMEGPYLYPEMAGAQPREWITTGSDYDCLKFFEVSEGLVKAITLDPRNPSNEVVIQEAKKRGIKLIVGHTDPGLIMMEQAIKMGIDELTHGFNQCLGIHHRDPGTIGTALLNPSMYTQLIFDGVHIHPLICLMALKVATRDRIKMITDSMAGAGLADGLYKLANQDVEVKSGEARLVENGKLAGSVTTMLKSFNNIQAFSAKYAAWNIQQVAINDAFWIASTVPHLSMGVKTKGRIMPGYDADMVLLKPTDNGYFVSNTIVGGNVVYYATY